MFPVYQGKVAQSPFEKSRIKSIAEEKFTQASKADKKFVSEKEKAAQVKLDKMAKLKALRLAKEASESA
ncbi:MAG TPA: hypothetical protein EYG65_09045 [Rhodospirillales bacterium]|nr:hypothetical protein [Rhodospirillales bacterium]